MPVLERGWISVRRGKIANWRVYSKGCDGSAYIYIRVKELYRPVYELLKKLRDEKIWGMETFYTGKNAARLGADGACAFMVEAGDGYFFRVIRRLLHGRHGQENIRAATGIGRKKPEYQTFFGIKGPGVPEKSGGCKDESGG